MSYAEFIESKAQQGAEHGFSPIFMPDFLFDFQTKILERAIRKGRSAIFADCGLGKTAMGLTWAENVRRKTNRPVLYLTPLAVANQTQREAEKFAIDSVVSRDGNSSGNIIITNYEKLHHFNPGDFSGVVCDESSILKSFSGARKTEITAFMRKVPYRLLQTATAAPNDYVELAAHGLTRPNCCKGKSNFGKPHDHPLPNRRRTGRMIDTYLTPDELRSLTGSAHVAKQLAYLQERGWCHTTDRHGRPKVLRKYHDAMLTGTNTASSAFEPDYGAFDGR